jgi:hypothetical protein
MGLARPEGTIREKGEQCLTEVNEAYEANFLEPCSCLSFPHGPLCNCERPLDARAHNSIGEWKGPCLVANTDVLEP